MRLIRLVSPNKEAVGEFQNLFPDIRVKPQSKIGLLSASLPLSQKRIVINTSQNKLLFKTIDSEANFTEVTLDDGYYNNGEIVEELNNKLNYALSSTRNSNMGFQWNCLLDKTNRLEIQFRRGAYIPWIVPNGNVHNITITAGGRYTPTIAPTGDNTFAVSSKHFINSCGVFRLKIKTTNDFIMGLFQEQADDTLLSATDMFYGIGIGSGNYTYISNKVTFILGTPVPATIDDIISIDLSEGSFNFNVYRGGNLLATIVSFPLDVKESYKTGITLQNVISSVDTIRWNPDPRQSETVDGVTMETYTDIDTENNVHDYHLDFSEPVLGAIPTPSNRKNRWMRLNFNSDEIMKMLGFAVLRHRSQLLKHTFKATNPLDDSNTPNSVVIELPNLSLESYDGQTSQRRNILSIIPTLAQSNNRLTFYAPTPIMLSMNNDREFNLRQLSCRILDLNDTVLLLEQPGAEITLLIS